MQWDHTVGVLCVGTGIGVSVAAVAAVEAGCDVLLVDCAPLTADDRPAGSPSGERDSEPDAATARYLGELVVDLFLGASGDATVALRTLAEDAAEPAIRSRRTRVEPFHGGRLRTWAQECADSGHGILYSRVTDRPMARMRCTTGDIVETAAIGSLCPDTLRPEASLAEWIDRRRDECALDAVKATSLERLIFEENDEPVGAVVTTGAGLLAVRAHRGLIFGIGSAPPHSTVHYQQSGGVSDLQVAVVSRPASRFARVELLGVPTRQRSQAYCVAGAGQSPTRAGWA